MRNFKILVWLMLCLIIRSNNAQSQILEQKISVEYQNKPLSYIIEDLRKTHKLMISYSNSQIPLDKVCSISSKQQSTKNVLDELSKQAGIAYRVIGKNIIFTKHAEKSKSEVYKKPIINTYNLEEIEYLTSQLDYRYGLEEIDQRTLKKVYLVEKVKILDSYDSKVDSLKKSSAQLSVSEIRAKLKTIMIQMNYDLEKLKSRINNYKERIRITKSDSLEVMNQNHTIENQDSLSIAKKWQISFATPLGTNGYNSSKCVNGISLNIIYGYARGLYGLEMGSIANIEKNNVKGVQFAGITNILGGDFKGTQFSGISNIVGNTGKGVQFSGITNIIFKDFDGFQASGITNLVNGNVYGTQLSGITNINHGNALGFQASGITNIVTGKMYGVQISGIANISGDTMRGLQISGIANISRKELKGSQASGVLNIAHKIHGSQIGLINIADSIGGVQIGLVSIAKNGYRQLEIFGSEALYLNASFKLGTKRFYNIFSVGIRPENKNFTWAPGFGIGSDFKLSSKTNMNIDLMCYQLNQNEIWSKGVNLLNQAKVNFSFMINNNARLFIGPVFNIKIVNDHNNQIPDAQTFVTWNLLNKNINTTNVMIWPGIHAGIRF